ncbi:MAG: NapF2 [Clostridia bacterium]|jgi:iron only hydrogenase large subunit-like protein|nr:NapF2 [Clostridia bacterium]
MKAGDSVDNKYFHSVVLQEDRCIGCTSCLKVCPTEAIRLRDGKARIIGEKCIDCGECIRICPNHAKSAITDKLSVLQNFKYKIAVPSLVLYGQFASKVGINAMLTALKDIGFDEVCEATIGTEIITKIIREKILKEDKIERPLINSSCPAILRLIQIRFPDLLPNVVDIETPVEITARIAKRDAAKRTGLDISDIGVIFISPCTARVTSIRNPLGIEKSYIDAAISMKEIYGDIVRNLSTVVEEDITVSTREAMEWSIIGGQSKAIGIEKYIAVDGINEVIKVLEEIETGRLEGLEFFEGLACSGGCIGGPLTIENPYIAKSKLQSLAKNLPCMETSDEQLKQYIKMYEDGFVGLTEPINPRAIMKLDKDISVSMKKMEMIEEILKHLPGLDCGVCGAPTCRAFAEDIVKGENQKSICIVKTMENFKKKKS